MDELIREYAEIANRIYEDQTAGDYTWNGLLADFVYAAKERGLE